MWGVRGVRGKHGPIWQESVFPLERPKGIIKTLRFEHATQNASGLCFSLHFIVYERIFGTRVLSTQPKTLSTTKEQKTMSFSSNRAALCDVFWGEESFAGNLAGILQDFYSDPQKKGSKIRGNLQ